MPVSFTAVVPTHDRRESLLRAVASVRGQTLAPEQILVVADGCTDGSVEAVREIRDERIVALDLPKGPALGWGNRNAALEIATGDVVAYLSDDDLWMPDHLQQLAAVYALEPWDIVQASSCRVALTGEIELFAMDWAHPVAREWLLRGDDSRTPMSAVSHRRGLAAEVGGWATHPPSQNGRLPKGDLDLWQRMVTAGATTAIVREVTVIHPPAMRDGFVRRHEQHRATQHEDLFARLSQPDGPARFRLEVAHAAYRAQSDLEAENLRLRDDRERAEQYARSLAEVLEARDAEIAGLRGELERVRALDGGA